MTLLSTEKSWQEKVSPRAPFYTIHLLFARELVKYILFKLLLHKILNRVISHVASHVPEQSKFH